MNIEKIKKDITHHLNYVPEMSQTTYNTLKGALDIINAIEDIKAELQKLADDEWNKQVGSVSQGFEDAIEVIDRYIGENT